MKITPNEILYRIENRKRWTIKNRRDLKKYFRDTISGELAHLGSFIILMIGTVILIYKESLIIAIILFILNVVINLYPIFLMRYNRFRISKTLKKPVTELLYNLN